MLGAFSLETRPGRRSSHLLEGVDVGEDGLLCLRRTFKGSCLTGSDTAEKTDGRVLGISSLCGGSRLIDDRLSNVSRLHSRGRRVSGGAVLRTVKKTKEEVLSISQSLLGFLLGLRRGH
jgi:hypothetical protein